MPNNRLKIIDQLQGSLAFTLAEVLITLGIIGVIAVITIPSMLQDSNDRAKVVALKKTYSILSSAYSNAVKEIGDPSKWDWSGGVKVMIDELSPYLRVNKNCSDGSQGCFPASVVYKLLSNSDWLGVDNSANPKMILADGTAIFASLSNPSSGSLSSGCVDVRNVSGNKNVCGYYYVDINGFMSPNQLGVDTFAFYLTTTGIIPVGQANDSWMIQPFTCLYKNSVTGIGCTGWVISNENLDYIKCPGALSWSGKRKCSE